MLRHTSPDVFYSSSLWMLTPVGVDDTCIMFDYIDNNDNREITHSALHQFISRIVLSSALLEKRTFLYLSVTDARILPQQHNRLFL